MYGSILTYIEFNISYMTISRLSRDYEPRLPLSVVSGNSARLSDVVRVMMTKGVSLSGENK